MKTAIFALLAIALVAAQDTAPAVPAVVEEAIAPALVEEAIALTPVDVPETHTPNVRVLPADVLRDYPGVCFASTACRTFKVGEEWSLAPFCGIARCRQFHTAELVEEVQDCGPVPNAHKCIISNTAQSSEPYPKCCPRYECPEGEKITYPETSVADPLPLLIPLEEVAPEAAPKETAADQVPEEVAV